VCFELQLDNEINQNIYPAIAMNATVDAIITDWLADVFVLLEHIAIKAVWEKPLKVLKQSISHGS